MAFKWNVSDERYQSENYTCMTERLGVNAPDYYMLYYTIQYSL